MMMITEIQPASAASQGNNPASAAVNGALFQSLLAAWLLPAEKAGLSNPSVINGTQDTPAFPLTQLSGGDGNEDPGVDGQNLSGFAGVEALWMLQANLGQAVIAAGGEVRAGTPVDLTSDEDQNLSGLAGVEAAWMLQANLGQAVIAAGGEAQAGTPADLTMGQVPGLTVTSIPAAYLTPQPTPDNPNPGNDGGLFKPADVQLAQPVRSSTDSTQVPGEMPLLVGEEIQLFTSLLDNDVQQGSAKGQVVTSGDGLTIFEDPADPLATAQEMSPNQPRLDKPASGRLMRGRAPQTLVRSIGDTDAQSQKTGAGTAPTIQKHRETEQEKGSDPVVLLKPKDSVTVDGLISPGDKGAEHVPQEPVAMGKTAVAGQKVSSADGQAVQPSHIEWESVRDQIIQAGRLVKREGWKQMDLKLEPESLGKILLQVATKNENVAVRLLVENQQVGRLLEENLPQLKQVLHEQGLKLDQVTVQVSTGSHFGTGQQQSFNGTQWFAGYAQSKFNKAADGWTSGDESRPLRDGNPHRGQQVDYLA
ncbi:MAG: flagellar hook-length control protein FliK [Bacillota bacterium]